ncbi:MAG: site-2 protease family protein, partial [Microcoleaceae cyanobacterium]
MFTASDNSITIIILAIALGILGWGYFRAKPFGKLGILGWLQSVSLMTPWLLFFGLSTVGIDINFVGVLILLVISTGLYIYLGKLLRDAGQDEILRSRAQEMIDKNKESSPSQELPQIGQTLIIKPPEMIPVPSEDLKLMQGIFGIETFFATETIPFQDGVIFKGNLRGDTELVHNRLSASLEERLRDRYRLFLVENPDGRPVVVILPSKNDPKEATLTQKILAVVLLLATISTCFETGGILLGFDFFTNPLRFREVLPIGLGILSVLIAHEIGHQVMARSHNVRFSLPFFIPTWQIGSFGAFNRFESLIPNRKVLFDVAISGPAAGGIVSFVMLIMGLLLSHEGSLFKLPTDFFKGSLLVGSLAKVVLGGALHEKIVDVHPL